MRFKSLGLRGPVRLVVKIVQPALANRDHARVIGALDQSSSSKVGMGIRFMGVNPDASPDVGVALGDGNYVAPFALPGGDVEEALDAAIACILKHFRLAFDEALVI